MAAWLLTTRSWASPGRFGWLLPLALLLSACGGSAPELPTGVDLGDAPDPSFPTQPGNSGGPALLAIDDDGKFLTDVLIGDCVTQEAQPKASDDCDDGQPLFQGGQTFQLQIRRTDAGSGGDYWLNVVVDLDDDGDWDPDNEWLVRNCPVPASGPPNETLQCATAGTALTSTQPGWLRIVVADRQAPAGGWNGSALAPPGEARGEVEDHLNQPLPTPDPPPATPTSPPATNTSEPTRSGPTTQPGFGRTSHPDPPDDAVLIDAQGQEIGPAAGHRADITRVELRWIEIDGQRYLEVWVYRNKTEASNSSAIQIWLVRVLSGVLTPLAVPFWELHEGVLRQGLQTNEGFTTYPGLQIEARQNGGELYFLIPAALVGDADGLLVYSFDRTQATDSRGYDETEHLPLPPAE